MSEYEANRSETVRENYCVEDEAGRILWIARMGKYVCREQPKIFQQSALVLFSHSSRVALVT